jgi:hypothetical protein
MISKMKKIKMLKDFYFNQNYKIPPTFCQFAHDSHNVIGVKESSIVYYYYGLRSAGCIFSVSSTKLTRQLDLLKIIQDKNTITENDLYNAIANKYNCKKTFQRDITDLFNSNKIMLSTINTSKGRKLLIQRGK